MRSGKKPGKSAQVGRELSSKGRDRTGRTQQVPLRGTSVIKTRSQHLQEYLHPAADSSKALLGHKRTMNNATKNLPSNCQKTVLRHVKTLSHPDM